MLPRYAFIFIAISLILGLMTGCHSNYGMPSPRPPSTVVSSNLQVALTMAPPVVRQMDPVTFTVRVSDAHGHLLSGANVSADLAMPAMQMGKNAVMLAPTGTGIYSGQGRFSMDGDWVAVVTASQGVDRVVRSFPIHVH